MTRPTARLTPLLAFAAIALVAVAGPASALYLATPLLLETESPQVNVGDTVDFTIRPSPENETAVDDWAGKTVRVTLSWDEAEGRPAEEPTSSEEDTTRTRTIENVTLAADATGAFSWTVPAEVDDKNVFIQLVGGDEETLAVIDLAVGDAEPINKIAASGPGEPVETPMETGEEQSAEDADDRDVPAAPLVALLVAVGAIALARRR